MRLKARAVLVMRKIVQLSMVPPVMGDFVRG